MEEILNAMKAMREAFDRDLDSMAMTWTDDTYLLDKIKESFHKRYEDMIIKFMDIINHVSR